MGEFITLFFPFFGLDFGDNLSPMPFASLLSLLFLIATDRSGKLARVFYGAALLGMAGVSWIARINPGGYNNV
ncbi:MAG: hypothetical protein GY805_23495 [Chloroflexi bacterium]|nr:hypothetical protein [Chloroflexota bacterium]